MTMTNESPADAVAVEDTAAVVKDAAMDAAPEAQEVEPEVNPFDFTAEPEDDAEDDVQAETADADYTLDFGEAFGGTDAVRSMITQHAREAGISVAAGSKFVAAVCKSLKADAIEQGNAAYKALEDTWGADFNRNMRSTKGVLHGLLKEGVIGEAEVAGLMSPAVFKLVHHLHGRMGEGASVGTKQAAKEDAATEYNRIMSDTKSHEFQVLMNPNHPEYKAVSERVNRLAGRRLF